MISFSLENKVALITGASRGIGEAIAVTLAEYGAACILVGRKIDALQEVQQKIGQRGGKAESMNVSPCIATMNGRPVCWSWLRGAVAYDINDFDTALGFVADKGLDVSQMINCRANFADLQEIFENLRAGDAEIVKAVVRP